MSTSFRPGRRGDGAFRNHGDEILDGQQVNPPAAVLNAYGVLADIHGIESLGNAGGFSGAGLWRLRTGMGTFCLRQWPEGHPDPARLSIIHRLLHHVARQDFTIVPVPLETRSGATWLDWNGKPWELAPWLPGRADFREAPEDRKLVAAMQSLARFHLAAATFRPPSVEKSPAMSSRLGQLETFVHHHLRRLPSAVDQMEWPEFHQRATRLLAEIPRRIPVLLRALEYWNTRPVPLQYVLRDVWHDHILFQGREVSGIVDFGAVRVESRSGDVARLLGSLVGNRETGWRTGLEAYELVWPLSREERQFVGVFDQSGLLLGGIAWLVWIALEGRRFEDPTRVLARLDEILHRLDTGASPLTLFGGRH